MSEDPAGSSMNQYSYCRGDPINLADPDGLYSVRYFDLRGPVKMPEPTDGVPGLLDAVMIFTRFIPGLDIISDLYFIAQAAWEGNWENFGLYLTLAALPIASVALLKVAGKAVKWVGRGAEDVGDAARIENRADDLLTVRHYTNAKGKSLIESSGYLKKDSFVTSPSEIAHGMNPRQIEAALEISPGKGEYYFDVLVSRNKLRISEFGPLTSGGKLQWQITEDIPLGFSEFRPWFSW